MRGFLCGINRHVTAKGGLHQALNQALRMSHLAPSAFTPVRNASTTAVVLEKQGKIEIRDIEINEPFTADDVRIDIYTTGICGSDVHYYQHGSIGPFVLNQPMVLGHECAGVVTEIGSNVTNLRVGDRVCMEPGIPDPLSKASRIGMYNVDPKVRFWATPPHHPALLADPAWAAGHGCLRPSLVHPANFTHRLPDHISMDEGAMVEPMAVGMQAATKAKIKPGDKAVVVGGGPIGMMTAIAALGGGCSHVYLVDISQTKLDVAEKLVPGRITGINVKTQDLKSVVMEATDGWGADLGFECSGNAQAASGMTELMAPGGAVVFVGCPSHPVPLDVTAMQVRELRLEFIFRYSNMYPKSIALLESGSVDLKSIVTNVFSFDQSIEAFNFMCSPPDTTIKSIIRLKEE